MDNITVEARRIDRPYKISNIADYFGDDATNLLLKLSALGKEGKIFKHDIKQLKSGDYGISGRALALLFIEGQDPATPEVLRSLADFIETTIGPGTWGDCLAKDVVLVKFLLMERENAQIKKRIEAQQQFEQAMTEFLEVVTPLNSLLH